MIDLDERRRRVVRTLGGTDDDPVLRLPGWDVAGDTLALHYDFDGLGRMTETVRFPGQDLTRAAEGQATSGAMTLLYLAASTSYAKAIVPSTVELGHVPVAAARMVEALLTDGLAEFAVHNGLFPLPTPTLRSRVASPTAQATTPEGVLVPIGGGKDSAVTATLAIREGWDAVGFAVNPRSSMERTAAGVGLPLLTAERRLDPRLLDWNAAGALNGHVPITAIVASIACVAATLVGRGDVLLSNEASADAPTRTVSSLPVNHQYSKSSAFESLHVAACEALTGGATRAISVLRPLPELLVAALFADLGAPLAAVNSCNRAYSTTSPATEWCGTCPKCLFVQLMLAPFTSPEAFREATGFDALARTDLVDAFGDLRDPQRKPFECVGTVEEVQLAFDLLATDPRWARHPAVVAHGAVPDERPAPRARLDELVHAVDTTRLPARYRDAVASAVLGLAAGPRP